MGSSLAKEISSSGLSFQLAQQTAEAVWDAGSVKHRAATTLLGEICDASLADDSNKAAVKELLSHFAQHPEEYASVTDVMKLLIDNFEKLGISSEEYIVSSIKAASADDKIAKANTLHDGEVQFSPTHTTVLFYNSNALPALPNGYQLAIWYNFQHALLPYTTTENEESVYVPVVFVSEQMANHGAFVVCLSKRNEDMLFSNRVLTSTWCLYNKLIASPYPAFGEAKSLAPTLAVQNKEPHEVEIFAYCFPPVKKLQQRITEMSRVVIDESALSLLKSCTSMVTTCLHADDQSRPQTKRLLYAMRQYLIEVFTQPVLLAYCELVLTMHYVYTSNHVDGSFMDHDPSFFVSVIDAIAALIVHCEKSVTWAELTTAELFIIVEAVKQHLCQTPYQAKRSAEISQFLIRVTNNQSQKQKHSILECIVQNTFAFRRLLETVPYHSDSDLALIPANEMKVIMQAAAFHGSNAIRTLVEHPNTDREQYNLFAKAFAVFALRFGDDVLFDALRSHRKSFFVVIITGACMLSEEEELEQDDEEETGHTEEAPEETNQLRRVLLLTERLLTTARDESFLEECLEVLELIPTFYPIVYKSVQLRLSTDYRSKSFYDRIHDITHIERKEIITLTSLLAFSSISEALLNSSAELIFRSEPFDKLLENILTWKEEPRAKFVVQVIHNWLNALDPTVQFTERLHKRMVLKMLLQLGDLSTCGDWVFSNHITTAILNSTKHHLLDQSFSREISPFLGNMLVHLHKQKLDQAVFPNNETLTNQYVAIQQEIISQLLIILFSTPEFDTGLSELLCKYMEHYTRPTPHIIVSKAVTLSVCELMAKRLCECLNNHSDLHIGMSIDEATPIEDIIHHSHNNSTDDHIVGSVTDIHQPEGIIIAPPATIAESESATALISREEKQNQTLIMLSFIFQLLLFCAPVDPLDDISRSCICTLSEQGETVAVREVATEIMKLIRQQPFRWVEFKAEKEQTTANAVVFSSTEATTHIVSSISISLYHEKDPASWALIVLNQDDVAIQSEQISELSVALANAHRIRSFINCNSTSNDTHQHSDNRRQTNVSLTNTGEESSVSGVPTNSCSVGEVNAQSALTVETQPAQQQEVYNHTQESPVSPSDQKLPGSKTVLDYYSATQLDILKLVRAAFFIGSRSQNSHSTTTQRSVEYDGALEIPSGAQLLSPPIHCTSLWNGAAQLPMPSSPLTYGEQEKKPLICSLRYSINSKNRMPTTNKLVIVGPFRSPIDCSDDKREQHTAITHVACLCLAEDSD